MKTSGLSAGRMCGSQHKESFRPEWRPAKAERLLWREEQGKTRLMREEGKAAVHSAQTVRAARADMRVAHGSPFLRCHSVELQTRRCSCAAARTAAGGRGRPFVRQGQSTGLAHGGGLPGAGGCAAGFFTMLCAGPCSKASRGIRRRPSTPKPSGAATSCRAGP